MVPIVCEIIQKKMIYYSSGFLNLKALVKIFMNTFFKFIIR